MIMGVWANLRVPWLILRSPEIYNQVLTLVILREFELVTIEKQTQDLTTTSKLIFKHKLSKIENLLYLKSLIENVLILYSKRSESNSFTSNMFLWY